MLTPHPRPLHPLLCAFLPLLISGEPHREPLASPARPPAPVVPAVEAAAPAAGIDQGWWQTVSKQIERGEYHASATPAGLQAPNRAQDLRTYFLADGIDVAPRQRDAASAWRFGWRTTRWGRENSMQSVEPNAVEPEAQGARVLYARPGFDEWYENKKEGIEQGFTVHARPSGEGWLRLTGRLEGALRAELREAAGAVDFLDEHGACVLRYAELHAWDAGGLALPSRLSIEGGELAISVDDREATYPITIDPLMTSPSWTAESDQASAQFGLSVATAGDVNADGFSDVIIGAYLYDNGQTDEGRAFVYHGSAAGLSVSPAWTAESNQASAQFGRSVATAGDVNGDGFSDVIVGAYVYDNGQTDEGRAFVYHGSATGLSLSSAWTAESDQATAFFGFSVGTAGDVNGDGFSDVIVGAWLYDNGQADEGRAFAYHGSATGLSLSPAWTTESNQVVAAFGYSVGTAGDINGDGFSDVIVGARAYDNGQTDEGRAFAYHGSAAGLSLSAAWMAESDQAGAFFGNSVGTAGDVFGDGFSGVIVGAQGYDNGQTDEGRAFAYRGSGLGLSVSPAWTAESNQAGAQFGLSVATAGDVNGDGFSDVIVGALLYDNGQSEEGRAFAYHGSATGLGLSPAWTAESNQADAQFGASVGTAGDVNGDGFSDVIVGAHRYDNGQTDEGRAFVYHGAAAGLGLSPAWTAESNQASASFGFSVATAGDVNGDGFSDVIVGAVGYDNGQSDEGRAFVYHGSATGLGLSPAWTAESDQLEAFFGNSVGTAGDVNGDGFSDVIVGASGYDNGQTGEGRAFAYLGSFAGLVLFPSWTAESDQASAQFGRSVATAGDVNGDGFSDVIVGAYVYDNGQTDEGRAFVYHGSATGLSLSSAWTAESDQATAFFGFSVGTAGDVNGDGFSDVIVGAWLYDNGSSDEGRAFVYYGNDGDGLDRSPRQARSDDSAPISLLGNSDSPSAFRLEALGRTPAGRGKVRLQWEVKPLGAPFDGAGLVTGPSSDTGIPTFGGSAVPLSELASGLSAQTLYHWRLRIVTNSPFFPRSPWLSMPGNSRTEMDVRTAPGSSDVADEDRPTFSLRFERIESNPVIESTRLIFVSPSIAHVRLTIHDVTGRLVATLLAQDVTAGPHTIDWNARDERGGRVPVGVYLARLESDDGIAVTKLVVRK